MITVAADRLWLGRAVGIADAASVGLRAIPRYLTVVVVLGLALFGALFVAILAIVVAAVVAEPLGVALGVAGFLVGVPLLFWAAARLSLVAPVAILERYGVRGSINRAWDLSRGHATMLFLLTLVVGISAGLPLWGGSLFASFAPDPVIAGVAVAISTLVFEPLPAIAVVLAWGDRTGAGYRDSEVMARGRGRRVAALLVFGLGAILLVAGLGVASQAGAAGSTLP
jgi:hypothetical protein